MAIENTKLTAEANSIRELNLYLTNGWTLLLSYVKHANDSQQPRFVVGWQDSTEPNVPEILDEWELNEIDRQRYR